MNVNVRTIGGRRSGTRASSSVVGGIVRRRRAARGVRVRPPAFWALSGLSVVAAVLALLVPDASRPRVEAPDLDAELRLHRRAGLESLKGTPP